MNETSWLEKRLADRVEELVQERDRLRHHGDKMASEIEARWTGNGLCDCAVCMSARDWRQATTPERERS